jgi:uncharacterized protein YecA (UPF0149 family)
MDNRTGDIRRISYEQWKALPDDQRPYYSPIDPTPKQERLMHVGRNERCPCGSGQKFKKCCMGRLARNGFMP